VRHECPWVGVEDAAASIAVDNDHFSTIRLMFRNPWVDVMISIVNGSIRLFFTLPSFEKPPLLLA
jgi:hypothetical protein